MCPPATSPIPDIALDVSDMDVILRLVRITEGAGLPRNVLIDTNPFHYLPENLPRDIWYLIALREEKTAEHGSWKAKGAACELFSDAVITGWTTTRQFYEGQFPHERKTDWMMQEFWITHKGHGESSKKEEPNSLCRIFLGDVQDTYHKKLNTTETSSSSTQLALPDDRSLIAIADSSERKTEVEQNSETGRQALEGINPNHPVVNPPGFGDFTEEDFLELLDLEIPLSPSSSSDNSSCMTMSSGEYFDSLDLMRDLEAEINRDPMQKDEYCKLNVSALNRPDELFMLPVSPGRSEQAVEEIHRNQQWPPPPADSNNLDNRVLQHSGKNQGADSRIEGSSSSCQDKGAPSSSRSAAVGKERKPDRARPKSIKRKYFCFMPF